MDHLKSFLSYSACLFCKEPPLVIVVVSDRLHAITSMVVRSVMVVLLGTTAAMEGFLVRFVMLLVTMVITLATETVHVLP
jgi:hypothetical protein